MTCQNKKCQQYKKANLRRVNPSKKFLGTKIYRCKKCNTITRIS